MCPPGQSYLLDLDQAGAEAYPSRPHLAAQRRFPALYPPDPAEGNPEYEHHGGEYDESHRPASLSWSALSRSAQALQDQLADAGGVGLAAGGLHDRADQDAGRGDLAVADLGD